ncbi:unnamed protein product, partial [Allacma fusca]
MGLDDYPKPEPVQYRKHIPCYAWMYLRDSVEHYDYRTPMFAMLPHHLVLLKENPQFIIILLKFLDHSNIDNIFNSVRVQLWTTAKIIFISDQIPYVFCPHCLYRYHRSKPIGFLTEIPENSSIFKINEIYRKMHRNLEGMWVVQSEDLRKDSCKLVSLNLKATPCAFEILQKHRNVTMLPITGKILMDSVYLKLRPAGAIITGYTLSSNLASRINNYNRPAIFEYVISGEKSHQISFSWIITAALSKSALWRSMDVATWIYSIFFAIITALSAQLVAKTKQRDFQLPTVMFAMMLEQDQLTLKNPFTVLGRRAMYLILTWSLVSIIVSNGYRGTLFSLLAALSIPDIPNDIRDILDT